MQKLNIRLRDAADLLLSATFPHRCPVCDGVLSFRPRRDLEDPWLWVHPECRSKLQPVKDPFCLRCGRPLSSDDEEYCSGCRGRRFSFHYNLAGLVYNEAGRASAARFKYSGRQEYALFYARMVKALYPDELERLKADGAVLVPVPIHRSRLRKRGYNQAQLIAGELSRLSGIPLRSGWLVRSRRTTAQKLLDPEERIKNLQHALSVRGTKAPELVLLIDDIYTTGSTLEACSRTLRASGVKQVIGLTAFIVARPDQKV